MNILSSIRDDRDIRQVLLKLRSFNWTEEVTAIMAETEDKELNEHLKKYLSSSSNDCGFCLEPESRYSMEVAETQSCSHSGETKRY